MTQSKLPPRVSAKVIDMLRKGPVKTTDFIPICLSQKAAIMIIYNLRRRGYVIECARLPNRPGTYTLIKEP